MFRQEFLRSLSQNYLDYYYNSKQQPKKSKYVANKAQFYQSGPRYTLVRTVPQVALYIGEEIQDPHGNVYKAQTLYSWELIYMSTDTVDGWSWFNIRLNAITGLTVPFNTTKSDTSTLSIDWGDGSAVEEITGTGNQSTSHEYASAGSYAIRIKITTGSGTWSIGQGAEATDIFGNNATQQYMVDSVYLDASVLAVGNSALQNAKNCQVFMAYGVTSIGNNVLVNGFNVAIIHLPAVLTIGIGFVQNGFSVATINAPNVTSIGSSTLLEAKCIQDFNFPKIITLGSSVSRNNSGLKVVVFPASTATIGANVIFNCPNLNKITCLATTPPTLTSANAFGAVVDPFLTIKVPSASLTAYQEATNWSTYAPYMVGI